MDDDLVDRIERAFTAAVQAHAKPIRLEVTRAQYEELSRQFGMRSAATPSTSSPPAQLRPLRSSEPDDEDI